MKSGMECYLLAVTLLSLAGCRSAPVPDYVEEVSSGGAIGTKHYQLTLVPLEGRTTWDRYQPKEKPGSVVVVTGLSYDKYDNHYNTYAIRTETRPLAERVRDSDSALLYAQKEFKWRSQPSKLPNLNGDVCVGSPGNEYNEVEAGIIYVYQAICFNFNNREVVEIYASGIKSHAGQGSEFAAFTGKFFETFKSLP